MTKAAKAALDAIALPNIGREAHTYLWHIIHNYESLGEVTVFCQGKPFDHAYDFHQTLRDFGRKSGGQRFSATGSHRGYRRCARQLCFSRSGAKTKTGTNWTCAAFIARCLTADGPEEYTFRLGAQFAVTREIIRKRPREFYERALQVSIDFPDAAHCFERSWPLVFGVANPDLVMARRPQNGLSEADSTLSQWLVNSRQGSENGRKLPFKIQSCFSPSRPICALSAPFVCRNLPPDGCIAWRLRNSRLTSAAKASTRRVWRRSWAAIRTLWRGPGDGKKCGSKKN